MNILFVSDVSVENVIGGAERVLFEQVTGLMERGYDAHILTRKLSNHKSNHDVIRGVNEWRYEVNNKTVLSFFFSTLRNCRRLFKSLQTNYRFDCISFHQPFSAFSIIKLQSIKNVRKLYTCHSLAFEEFISRNTEPEGFWKKILYFLNIKGRRWIEKKTLVNSDVIVTLSQFTSDKLVDNYKIPRDKIAIIPGGVDLKKFYPASEKEPIRERLKIPREKVVLFTVRNLVPRMGLENLILTIKALINAVPHIYLVIGGDGPLKNDLISLAKQSGVDKFITFAGFIPEEELPSYYQMADIFILPTKELEGFGLVTLESMASGVPVLGTPVGGTKEILGRFDQSFLFKDTTPEAMAALITEKYSIVRDNPPKWREISQQCRNYVKKNYSWDKNVDALENICFMNQ